MIAEEQRGVLREREEKERKEKQKKSKRKKKKGKKRDKWKEIKVMKRLNNKFYCRLQSNWK